MINFIRYIVAYFKKSVPDAGELMAYVEKLQTFNSQGSGHPLLGGKHLEAVADAYKLIGQLQSTNESFKNTIVKLQREKMNAK